VCVYNIICSRKTLLSVKCFQRYFSQLLVNFCILFCYRTIEPLNRNIQNGLFKNLSKKIIKCLSEVGNEAIWHCSGFGIQIQSEQIKHSYLTFFLRPEGFDKFHIDGQFSICVNLTHLSNILRCAPNNATITMEYLNKVDAITFMF
jgi:hypothetical protein